MEKLDIKLIKEQYPSLKMWSDNHAAELYRKIQEHQVLKEFLSTVNIFKTIEHLKKQFPKLTAVPNNDDQAILINFPLVTKNLLDKVNVFMDKFGYYPSTVNPGQFNGGKYSNMKNRIINEEYMDIIYEAKYDTERTITGPYLYHITPDISLTKIKNIGITPKTQGKLANHPGRIYVLTNLDDLKDYDIDSWPDISYALWNNSKTKDKVEEMNLLRIDVSKLPKDIKFYKDPNFFIGDAVWTYRNIPPNAIEVIDKININNF